jgi:hypothetical protein
MFEVLRVRRWNDDLEYAALRLAGSHSRVIGAAFGPSLRAGMSDILGLCSAAPVHTAAPHVRQLSGS